MKRARPSGPAEAPEESEAPPGRGHGQRLRDLRSHGLASAARLVRSFRERRRLRRAAAAASILLVAFVLGVLVVGPVLVARVLERYGDDASGRSAAAEDVRIDPFTLSVILEGVELQDAAARASLRIDLWRLNFAFTTLFRRTVVLDEVVVDAPSLRVMTVNGDVRPGLSSAAEWLRSVAGARPLEIGHAELVRGRIEMVDDTADGSRRELVLSDVTADVHDFSSEGGRSARFDARLSMQDGAVLEFGGSLPPGSRSASGRVAVESVDVALVRAWLGPAADADIAGRLDGQAQYTWSPDTLVLEEMTVTARQPRIGPASGRVATAAAGQVEGRAEIGSGDGTPMLRIDGDAGFEDVRVSAAGGEVLFEAGRLALEEAMLHPARGQAGLAGHAIDASVLRLRQPTIGVRLDIRQWNPNDPLAAIRHPLRATVAVGREGGAAPLDVRSIEIVDGRVDIEDTGVSPPVRVGLLSVDGTLGRSSSDTEDTVIDIAGRVSAVDGNDRGGAGDGVDGAGAADVGRPAGAAAPADDAAAPSEEAEAGTAAFSAVFEPGGRNGSVDLTLERVEAAALSPWFAALSGLGLAAGSVDLDVEYRVRGGRLDGEAALTTRGLELAGADGERRPDDLSAAPEAAATGPDQPAARASDATARQASDGDGAGGEARFPWRLAQALLEDGDGRVALTLPLHDVNGRGAAAVGAALADAAAAVTAEPFSVLAELAQSDAAAMRGIGFEPGEAEPGDAAFAALDALAEALRQRPRLALRILGRADQELDRDALATRQIELHVTLATAGQRAVARPEPVDFTSPRAWDVLNEFATERLGAERLETIAS